MSQKTLSTKPKVGYGRTKKAFYNDIRTTPMSVWNDIQDNANLKALCTKGKPTEEELTVAWNALYDSYLREYGITEEYKQFLFKQRNLAYAILDDIANSTPFTKMMVKKMEREVAEFFKDKPKQNSGIVHAQIERFMFRELNPETTTVYQFENYRRLRQIELSK